MECWNESRGQAPHQPPQLSSFHFVLQAVFFNILVPASDPVAPKQCLKGIEIFDDTRKNEAMVSFRI